jgi:DNA topoisomerase-1
MENFIIRKPFGDTFTYQYPSGKTVKNKGIRRWVKSLAIPPAWQEVQIDLDRSAKVFAVGRDAQNRKQYIYNPKWTERASEQKFERILRFAKALSTMRRVTGQHITQRPIDEKVVLACMTRMLDDAFFRPGNPTYTKDNETYGLTTLRVKHMNISGNHVEFDYVGKSHQQQHREVDDKHVAKVLTQLEKMTGYELFDIKLPEGERKKVTSQDLNQYIAQVMGEDFSAKDFRTWAGTVLMAVALEQIGPANDQKLSQSNVLAAVKKVASELGNTPAVCRANYIHPNVIFHYESGRTLAYFRKQLKRTKTKYFTPDEKATLKLLEYLVDTN